jgi:hypothetical protein
MTCWHSSVCYESPTAILNDTWILAITDGPTAIPLRRTKARSLACISFLVRFPGLVGDFCDLGSVRLPADAND